jgi:hypothetical protein
MIALRAFIVIAHPAPSGSAIEQSVLVGMLAALNRLRHPPDHHFQDRTVLEIEPLALLAIMPTTTIVVNFANEVPMARMKIFSASEAGLRVSPRIQQRRAKEILLPAHGIERCSGGLAHPHQPLPPLTRGGLFQGAT